ncbi:MAG: hypothetical protein ACR2JF_09550 [Iamia sp.]
MPDATWTVGDTTYTVAGLRDVGQSIRARAGGLTTQIGARAEGADAALAELRGPVATTLRDQATRTIDALVVLVTQMRRAAAVCETFPDPPGPGQPPAPASVRPAQGGEAASSGSPRDLRAFARASDDGDEEVRRAAATVSLDGVTLTKRVRTERPAPTPVPPPEPGTPALPPVVTISPPEPVDPRTMISLPEPSGEAARVTAASDAGARLARAAAEAFDLADGGISQWADEVVLLAVLADVREDHGLGEDDLARELQDFWAQAAADRAGIDLEAWDPSAGAFANEDTIVAVYEYYGQLFLDHPELQWAGMANMIGPSFAAGFFDLDAMGDLADGVDAWMDGLPGPVRNALPPEVRALADLSDLTEAELRFYETTFLEMQKEIFLDQAVMHEAYVNGGLPAIEELRSAGLLDQRAHEAWRQIDQGAATGDADLVSAGNGQLLWREQNQIINDNYDAMYDHFPSGPVFTYGMTVVGAPSIPGAGSYGQYDPVSVSVETPGPERIGTPDRIGTPERVGPFGVPSIGVDIPSVSVDNPTQGEITVTTPFPAGNIANQDDRWGLIVDDTLPAYQGLLADDPEGARAIIDSPVADRIDDQRLRHQVDDIVERLLDWDVDIDQ